MVRYGVSDAYEAARRCLQAMGETQDLETRLSLWRAALRYRGLALEKVGVASRETWGGDALTSAARGGEHW